MHSGNKSYELPVDPFNRDKTPYSRLTLASYIDKDGLATSFGPEK